MLYYIKFVKLKFNFFLLQAEENDIVTFDFQQFNVEPGKDCKHDYVKIYNKFVSEKLLK